MSTDPIKTKLMDLLRQPVTLAWQAPHAQGGSCLTGHMRHVLIRLLLLFVEYC